MQERKITLIDIGAGALPSVTPVTAQNSSWFPTVYVSRETPPVDGVTPEPVADGVLIEWDAVDQAGVVYIIERGPSQNGPWTEIHRTTETRYLYSDGSGQKWFFRITASVRGKPGQGTVVEATPAPTTAELIAAQQKLDKEIVDRALADANEAASRVRDLALVNAGLVQEAQTRVTQIGQTMDAVAAESQTRATQLLNEKMERQAAITAVSETQQNGFDSLSRAMSEVAAGSGTQFDSKRIWDFNLTVENWTGNGAPVLVDGWLRPANAAANPYVQSPGGLAIDGSAYRYVKMRIKKVGKPTWAGGLQWITTTDSTWNAAKRVAMVEPAWDSNGVATMDAADVPWWPATVAAIRLQLGAAQALSDYYLVDWVAIGRPSPGASVALVQEETQARVTALAAEATQRNTLAVQMRGNYTGTDLSQAQGFIGDERTARAAADSAQVQRITTMEARMPAGSGGLATSASVTTLQDAMVAADQANAQATTKVSSDLRAAMSRGLNLVNNGDIGNDLAGWQISGGQPGAWSVSATEGRGGGKCLKGISVPFGVVTSAQANLNEGIEVKVGRRYRLRAWVKVSADYVGDTDNSKIRVGAVRTDGTEVLLWSRTYNSGWTNWTLVENVFTIAEGTARFRLSAGLRNTAGYVLVDDFELVDVTDEEQIASTASGLSSLTTRTGIIEGTQNAQATLIGQVQSGLAQTNGNVTAAQQAAQAAADAAGAKGKVIYGTALPAATDRLPQNLWIDSTGNANTPKRWNGTAWAAVSDKVATDAAAAAAAAQQTANAAQSQASVNAGALSTLDTKVTQIGNAVTSQGTALTNVTASLQNIGGDNLLSNGGMEDGTPSGLNPPTGWNLERSRNEGGALSHVDSPLTGGGKALRVEWTAVNAKDWIGINRAGPGTNYVKVEPNTDYVLSSWVRGSVGTKAQLYVQWMNSTGGTVLGTATLPEVAMTGQWQRLVLPARSRGDAVLARVYVGRQFADQAGSYAIEIDNVMMQQGTVATAYVPSGAETLAKTSANAAATTTLTGTVTALQGNVTALGQSMTAVSAELDGLRTLGDNLVPNSAFTAGAVGWQVGGSPVPVWSGSNGDGKAGFLLDKTGTATNPSLVANSAQWCPSRGIRRYRAVVRARGVSGAMNLMMRLERRNRETGATGNNDKTLMLTTSFASYTVDFDAVDATIGAVRLWAYCWPNVAAIRIDRVELYDVTDQLATENVASGLSALTTTVSQQGGQITALGQQVNQVGASVAGKADAQVVQTLTAMVKDTMTGGGNLLSNTLFKDGRRGWGWWNSGNGTWNELGLVAGPEWAPPGLAHFGGFAPSNLALNTQFWAGDEQPVPVVAGKRYCFSAYINCHRVGLALLISFRDANGNTVGEQYSGPADATNIRPPITLERLKRLSASMVAPASAVYARVGYYLRGLGLSNNEGNYFWIFQPMLEEMREGQTGPSPYSAGGGETLAGYSLYVTADGLTGGMVTKNDGKVVDMKILANVLQILSPNQPEGIEMRDGYIRVWKGNSQRIIGTGFGGGDLMDYFGPNVGAGAANKLNATMWMDVNGNAYWGGSLSAGIWKNANRTSSTAANPYVEVGPFAAHGKQRVVVASFSTFSPTYTTWYDGRSSSNEPPPPAIASSTVLRLRRNVGAGLELVSQQAFPASAVLVNLTYHDRDAGIRELPNGGWQQEYYFACSGSFTATEPGSTFQNFIYEGAITTQAIPQIVSQTIAVVSTEEP